MKYCLLLMFSASIALTVCAPQPTTTSPVRTAMTLTAPNPTPTLDMPRQATPGQAMPQQASTPTHLFDYDATIPFEVNVNSEKERDGVTIVDLSYAAHDPAFSPNTGGRTIAYLVKPPGVPDPESARASGPFAGVVYLHWLGQNNSNRGQYLDEAVMLAQRGTVCLLLQGFFPWMSAPKGTENDHKLIAGQVIELRRATDFLLAQPGVDSKRLGYVGHDYGAMYGGILSGIDRRFKTFVLIAGVPSFADWAPYWGVKTDQYLQLVQDEDPIRYLPAAAPASFFFQFGKNDSFVSDEAANQLYQAASEPKKVEFYEDLHQMATDAVRQARLDWLMAQLELAGSVDAK